MTYSQRVSSNSRKHTSKNPPSYRPPSFLDLYNEILIGPEKVKDRIKDSIQYSPEDFVHFGDMISKDPNKIPQALEEVEKYASTVGNLISKNTVGLKGYAFERFHQFANVLKFYTERIGDIKKMADEYEEGDGISTIANSLGNIKFLLTQLESDVTGFLRRNKKHNEGLKP